MVYILTSVYTAQKLWTKIFIIPLTSNSGTQVSNINCTEGFCWRSAVFNFFFQYSNGSTISLCGTGIQLNDTAYQLEANYTDCAGEAITIVQVYSLTLAPWPWHLTSCPFWLKYATKIFESLYITLEKIIIQLFPDNKSPQGKVINYGGDSFRGILKIQIAVGTWG